MAVAWLFGRFGRVTRAGSTGCRTLAESFSEASIQVADLKHLEVLYKQVVIQKNGKVDMRIGDRFVGWYLVGKMA